MAEPAGKITLKPPGSFVSKGALTEAVEAAKAAEAINQTQSDTEKAKQAAAEKARVDEIDKMLPKEVFCFLGKVSFDLFKTFYKAVWDQVENKDHLARGYVIVEKAVAPHLNVIVRSFKTKEMRLLTQFSPVASPETATAKYADETFTFRNARLALGILSFDGKDLGALPLPSEADKDLEKWMALSSVKARIEMIESLPEELVDAIAALVNDTILAYRFALQENLKNQFAPL